MVTLPTTQGQRRIARPTRGVATISPAAAGAVGRAVEGVGQAASQVGEAMFERETTAAATDRDVMVSEEIRSLLYDPETGFAAMKGQGAVSARESTIAKLEALKDRAYEGLNATARRKLKSSLQRRIDGAKGTVERHTLGERDAWLNGASAARVEAAYQDSLFNPADTAASLQIIENETLARGVREGWGHERTEIELSASKSKLFTDQITRIASADPIAAMEYLRENQDNMIASDVVNLETKLQPEVKRAVGRAKGVEAFVGTGNLTAAFEIASDTLGMNEHEQNIALKAYLKDGGVNLDPAVTAWCAAHVNATLAKAGMSGTGSNMARSFLNWGEEVSTPKQGDIVVLKRGDPPYGHVGFFDSYNEDGSINILGGNQSDSVSVSSYPANKVLGIRRKVNPDASSAAQGLDALVKIKDPIEREAAINEYNLRVGVTQGQQKAALAAAKDAAFQMIEAGGSLDDLSIGFKQSLGQESMASLRSYQSTLAKGETVQTDDATYYELRQMQSNNPAAFRELNLLTYRGKLDDSDWQKMVDAQTKPASDITTSAASTLMATASRQLKAAGFDPSAKPGTDEASDIAAMQSGLLRWQDDFVSENKRAPTQTEVDSQIGRELLPVVINPRGPLNEIDATLFQLQDLDLSQGDLAESSITVMDTEVPPAVINEQIIALQQDGLPVTPENLLERIVLLFEAAGLR